jgi:hypothetical protein
MQKMSFKLFAATIILGLLALPITMSASQDKDKDDQPHMEAALAALKQAEMHLKEAAHDKGGHRVAALKATQEAIKHVQEGIKVGDKNEDKHEHKMDKK